MAIYIRVADVIEKGREVYLTGGLSAQGPDAICAYRDPTGRPCIVGTALNDEQARALDNEDDGSITELLRTGVVETDDANTLEALQDAHDRWARGLDQGQALRAMLGLEAAP